MSVSRTTVFGGIKCDVAAMRRSLRRCSYTLTFVPGSGLATLTAGLGLAVEREVIMSFPCTERKAGRFAKALGLENESFAGRNEWRIRVPEFKLNSDGSEDAKVLHLELLKSGLPFILVPDQPKLTLVTLTSTYIADEVGIPQLVRLIRHNARVYAR